MGTDSNLITGSTTAAKMFQQVIDFIDESEALYTLLDDIKVEQFSRPTQFKQWTINDILGHLHMWNWAAELSLHDEPALLEFMHKVFASVGNNDLRSFEKEWRNELSGHALLDTWHEFLPGMMKRFGSTDPKKRVKWAGPDMSVLSSITARLMETWTHGQAIYDLPGIEREDKDRIKNIATLGINTFSWTFKNRGLPVPQEHPYVKLHSPSGQVWEWNPVNEREFIEGTATGFCQIVTQTRNVADTDLTVTGDVATHWMSIAQCFAGGPEDPPAPGQRFRAIYSHQQ